MPKGQKHFGAETHHYDRV